jgi:hypothetical protein
MEHKDELLEGLAELRAAHDKSNSLMAEIAAIGARALKGGTSLPSRTQLQRYAQALAQAQRLAAHCEDLLLSRPASGPVDDAAGARSYLH